MIETKLLTVHVAPDVAAKVKAAASDEDRSVSSWLRRVIWGLLSGPSGLPPIVSGTTKVGVWGSIPGGRVSVKINIGDGPYLHGYSLLQ
jgi:hypothetical protein